MVRLVALLDTKIIECWCNRTPRRLLCINVAGLVKFEKVGVNPSCSCEEALHEPGDLWLDFEGLTNFRFMVPMRAQKRKGLSMNRAQTNVPLTPPRGELANQFGSTPRRS
jgi:hypothetical protein